jgi:hypothetical protein
MRCAVVRRVECSKDTCGVGGKNDLSGKMLREQITPPPVISHSSVDSTKVPCWPASVDMFSSKHTLVLLAVLGRSAAFLLPSAPCRSVAGGARAGLSAPRMDMQVRTPGKLERPTQPAVHVPPSAPSHER